MALVKETSDCRDVQDEAETLRQELSAIVLEIREYANGLKALGGNTEGQIADILFNIARGDR